MEVSVSLTELELLELFTVVHYVKTVVDIVSFILGEY